MPDSVEMTVRQRLEASKAAFSDMDKDYKTTCFEMFAHASIALYLLDKAQHRYRCGPGCWDCDIRNDPRRSGDVRVALVDDPEMPA